MVFDSYRDNLYIGIESAGARANLTDRLKYGSVIIEKFGKALDFSYNLERSRTNLTVKYSGGNSFYN
jgi:hypothetical protein